MALNLFGKFKEKESLLAKYSFVVSLVLLVIVFFCYFLFSSKIYLQKKQIFTIKNDAAQYATDEQKNYDKKFANYKKKIDDFTTLINAHAVSSNIFTLLEEKTLLDVWFYNFSLSKSINELRLSGEAKDAETFSRQVQAFEKSGYITSVRVLDSRISESGKSIFILNLSLDPKVFKYTSNPLSLYE